jgi:hypothetical protein
MVNPNLRVSIPIAYIICFGTQMIIFGGHQSIWISNFLSSKVLNTLSIEFFGDFNVKKQVNKKD